MGNFVLYILEWSLTLLLLLLVWKIAFYGTTLHRFNRYYLLGATLLSALVPLVGLNISLHAISIPDTRMAHVLQEVVIYGSSDAVGQDTMNAVADSLWAWILVGAYAVYVTVLIVGWIRGLLRTVRFLKGKPYHRIGRFIRLYRVDGEFGPFSWMNCIVVPGRESGFARRAALIHEVAHVSGGHCLDLVFLMACTVLNPVCWLVMREIKVIHEYEADEEVISRLGGETRDYQRLLIMRTVGAEAYALASSFNLNIKQRIIMMKKEKTLKRRMLYALAVIPVIGLMLAACGSQKKMQASAGDMTVDGRDGLPEDVMLAPEQMPEFSGGMMALMQYLQKTIRYPKEARDNNIQGRVLVDFIIEKDGSVTNVGVSKSVDRLLDDEAVRVVSLMPNWTPGSSRGETVRVKYTIPINFRLNDESSDNRKDVVYVAWSVLEDGVKHIRFVLTDRSHMAPDTEYTDMKNLKKRVREVRRKDEGQFAVLNSPVTMEERDAVQNALRELDGLDIKYIEQ